jgi:hypothetical protein
MGDLSMALVMPLAGAKAKAGRARELTHMLEQEIGHFVRLDQQKIVGTYEPHLNRYAFRVVGPEVPLRFSVIAGEVIHHLRSCFDHIIWSLAGLNGAERTTRLQFPVCDAPEKFLTAVNSGSVKGIPPDALAIIEAYQPYRASEPPNSLLSAIHTFDIADKHRLLLVVLHTLILGHTLTITENSADPSTGFGIELPGPDGYPWAIENGAEVHWIPTRGGPNPDFEMETNAKIEVSFDRIGTYRRPGVVPILEQCCKFTENAIEVFSQFFPQP